MTSAWRTFNETAAHVRVCADTLRERMRLTPAHIERPWIEIGTGTKRRTCSFEAAKTDTWWREVNEWLRSERSEGSGKSGGATQMGAREAGSARRSASLKSSVARSKKPTPSADDGNYLTLLRPQTSRPA